MINLLIVSDGVGHHATIRSYPKPILTGAKKLAVRSCRRGNRDFDFIPWHCDVGFRVSMARVLLFIESLKDLPGYPTEEKSQAF